MSASDLSVVPERRQRLHPRGATRWDECGGDAD
jgi:hypothetical protein